jgi:peptidyl-dipeptidase Dcp
MNHAFSGIKIRGLVVSLFLIVLMLLTLAGCGSIFSGDNPLLSEPIYFDEAVPFDELDSGDYLGAIEMQLAAYEDVVREITDNPDPPTFENTIAPLFQQRRKMALAYDVLMFLGEVESSEEYDTLMDEAMTLSLSAQDAVAQNPDLFARVKKVYESTDLDQLTPEQVTLLDKIYWDSLDLGVALTTDDQDKIIDMIDEITTNEVQFNRNVLADGDTMEVYVDDEDLLEGLAEEDIELAAGLAADAELDGWLFTYASGLLETILSDADDPALREEAWSMLRYVANQDNEYDNKKLLLNIFNQRMALAQLLGYDNYASMAMRHQMAENTRQINSFINALVAPALRGATREINRVIAYARESGHEGNLEPWDHQYYESWYGYENRDDLSYEAMEYYPADQVRDGIFALYGELYGLEFIYNDKIPVYHPDVEVYEVWDQADERYLGLLYIDIFARERKNPGAYVLMLRSQYRDGDDDVRPHAMLVCDFWPAGEGDAALLDIEDITVFLHESGHAIHVLLSDVEYAVTSGYTVEGDFVEMPSTLMENFATNYDFMKQTGRHYETGATISDAHLKAMWQEGKRMAARDLLTDVQWALLDLRWHEITAPYRGKVPDFEAKIIEKLNPWPESEYELGLSLSTDFTHVVSGGYASTYYGYLWSEALSASAYERLAPGGKISPDAAASLRNEVLSRGGTEPAKVLFGRYDPKFAAAGYQPDPAVILRRRGVQ